MAITEKDTRTSSKTQRPKRYTVVFLNDDFTPMDFVMMVLTKIFGQSFEEAERLTWDIHKKGRGNAGLFTLEVAETKVAHAMAVARAHEFPFTCQPAEA